jgi:hypothetical protein
MRGQGVPKYNLGTRKNLADQVALQGLQAPGDLAPVLLCQRPQLSKRFLFYFEPVEEEPEDYFSQARKSL